MPKNIRSHIAHLDCVNDFDNVLLTADCIYKPNKQNHPVSAIKTGPASKTSSKAASTASEGASRDLDTSADAPAFDQINQLMEELAAFNNSFKKRGTGLGCGWGRGAQQTRGAAGKPQSKNRGNPHPDGPPDNACGMHWRLGRSAYYCQN